MKQLLLPCLELGTVSSSPDALGLYFSLLTSGVIGFDRKGMMLHLCPWAECGATNTDTMKRGKKKGKIRCW